MPYANANMLQDWLEEQHEDIYDEWDISAENEYMICWDWLEFRHPDILLEFRREKEEE